METPVNSQKTTFYDVNKQINAFSGKRGGMRNFGKSWHFSKNSMILFKHSVYYCLLYVYSISVNCVYCLFNLLIGKRIMIILFIIKYPREVSL